MSFLNTLNLTGLFLLGLTLLSHTDKTVAKGVSNVVQKGKGSTAQLEKIMIGRCFNYLGIINPKAGEKNCLKLWESFLSAFNEKDPCKITKEDYKPFLKMADQDIPIDQSIFWSQTKKLVLQYADVTQKVMPLENTLIGFMLDGLNWCGKLSSPGPNYEACPAWNSCTDHSMRSFWRAASENYAMKARGEVTVLLNGSANAFRENSIFHEIELGKLDNKRVTSVNLWIVDNIDGPDKESCGVGSVAVLENILKEKKIKYTCVDNYKPVKMLQCILKLDRPSCNIGT